MAGLEAITGESILNSMINALKRIVIGNPKIDIDSNRFPLSLDGRGLGVRVHITFLIPLPLIPSRQGKARGKFHDCHGGKDAY